MTHFVFRAPQYGELVLKLENAIAYSEGISSTLNKEYEEITEVHRKERANRKNNQSWFGKIIDYINSGDFDEYCEDSRFLLFMRAQRAGERTDRLLGIYACINTRPDEIVLDGDIAEMIETLSAAHISQQIRDGK